MGKAIIISGADFSVVGMGQVTPTEYRELLSITLDEGETVGNNVTINVVYNPYNATYKELIWSIDSGSEYATISNGVLTVLKGANENTVTVKATSFYDNTIYDTIDVLVTYDDTNDYDAVVEYIETDGTAYIDTGVNTSSNTRFDIECYLPVQPTNGSIFPFGARLVNEVNCLEFLRAKNTSLWSYRFGNNSPNTPFGSAATDGDLKINNLTSVNKVDFVCGGTSHSITATSNTFDTGLNFFLFRLNNAGSPRETPSGIRFYSCKLYTGNILMRDLIAVRKNGVGYLFDQVSGTLFGNAASSGSFSYGNDKPQT